MPTMERHWTAQMIFDLPDDRKRYEVVDGVLLVTSSVTWRHQAVLGRLLGELGNYLKPLGRVDCLYPGPADISWADDVLLKPDLFVVAPEHALQDWAEVKNLLLAIEVTAPNTEQADRGPKRVAYQRYGVATYGIVDHEVRAVEVWHPGDAAPQIVTDVLRWQVAPDAPVLKIELPELLSRLPG